MRVRYFFFIVCFMVLFVSQLSAQQFYGGVIGGFNGSQVEGDYTFGYHKLGGVVGAWVSTDLNERFVWNMEVKYSEKGSRVVPNKKNDYWKYIYRLNYAEIPVLLGYRYDEHVSLFTGASVGYLIKRYGEDNYGEDPNFFTTEMNQFDYEFILGIRADFDLLIKQDWAKHTQLDFRWQNSIVPFIKYGPASRYIDTGQFNNLFSTTLLYRIDW